MKTEPAPDIKNRIALIVKKLDMQHIDSNRIVCMRSYGSKSKAVARIWSLPKIWQKALGIRAHYIIEVVSERFDKLSAADQDRTLIHELLHIPKTFSGAILSHISMHFNGCGGFVRKHIDGRTVEKLFQELEKKTKVP
ncbi:MAG: putative metallopeptidase [Candidatus Aenigmatarchaeota archaeon]